MVESQARLINTEEGRISALVDEKRVSELPLNGRNVFQLMELQPGATGNPGNVVLGGSAGGDSAFMNGQRNRANNFLLDGTDNNDQFTAGRVAVNPNVDIVQEFRVSSNNISAEFGRNSASVVNVVTKQGTNRVHGTALRVLPQRRDGREDRVRHRQGSARVQPVRRHDGRSDPTGQDVLLRSATRDCASHAASRWCGPSRRRSSGRWCAALYPNSIGNFLFQNFPSPNPTSNIRDIGRPVAGTRQRQLAQHARRRDQSDYASTGGTQYRNALQATPDGIPDIGTVNFGLEEKTDDDQFNLRVDHELTSSMRLHGPLPAGRSDQRTTSRRSSATASISRSRRTART